MMKTPAAADNHRSKVRNLTIIVLLTGLAILIGSCASRLDYRQVAILHPAEQPWPDSSFAYFEGVTIHYRQAIPAGEPKGYVLLLHGLAGSSWSWQTLMPALQAAGYQVLALDIPPFGFSSNDFGAFKDAGTAAAVLKELLTSIHDGQWILGGHSMGGRYVAELSLRYPDFARALLLFDGAVLAQRDDNGNSSALNGFFGPLVRAYVRDTLSRPRRLASVLKSAYDQKPSEEAVLAYAAPFSQPGKIDALLQWAAAPGAASVLELTELKLPVLLLWGRKDTWVPLESAYTIKESVPQASLVIIDDAAHNPMETHPDQTIAAVLAFLEGLAPGAQER
ncbi:MAG: alpha/beta hydrolase [Spirochaetes bacterium]|nr:alpha/beta hydrolase [Spirochaetota bacterium]